MLYKKIAQPPHLLEMKDIPEIVTLVNKKIFKVICLGEIFSRCHASHIKEQLDFMAKHQNSGNGILMIGDEKGAYASTVCSQNG